jgi:hypothetical protein
LARSGETEARGGCRHRHRRLLGTLATHILLQRLQIARQQTIGRAQDSTGQEATSLVVLGHELGDQTTALRHERPQHRPFSIHVGRE